MKTFISSIFSSFVVVTMFFLLPACQREEDFEPVEEMQFAAVNLEVRDNYIGEQDTKSAVQLSSADGIKEILFLFFDPDTGNMLTYGYEKNGGIGYYNSTTQSNSYPLFVHSTTANIKNITIYLPTGKRFDVYALANYKGHPLSGPSDSNGALYDKLLIFDANPLSSGTSYTDEQLTKMRSVTRDMMDQLVYTITSSDSPLSLLNSKGIPMVAKILDHDPIGTEETISVDMKRIFARYRINFDISSVSDPSTLVNSSITVSNANRMLPVFSDNYKQTNSTYLNLAYEQATSADKTTVVQGGLDNCIDLFLLENCQGNASDSGFDLSKCTYFNINNNDGDNSLGVSKRKYYFSGPDGIIGENYDVKRNYVKTYTIDLSGDKEQYPWFTLDESTAVSRINGTTGTFKIRVKEIFIPESFQNNNVYKESNDFGLPIGSSNIGGTASNSTGLFLGLNYANEWCTGWACGKDSGIDGPSKYYFTATIKSAKMTEWEAAGYPASNFILLSDCRQLGTVMSRKTTKCLVEKLFIPFGDDEDTDADAYQPYIWANTTVKSQTCRFTSGANANNFAINGHKLVNMKVRIAEGNSVRLNSTDATYISKGSNYFQIGVSMQAIRKGRSRIQVYDSTDDTVLSDFYVSSRSPKIKVSTNGDSVVDVMGNQTNFSLVVQDQEDHDIQGYTNDCKTHLSYSAIPASVTCPDSPFKAPVSVDGNITLTTTGVAHGYVYVKCTGWGSFQFPGNFDKETRAFQVALKDIDNVTIATNVYSYEILNPFYCYPDAGASIPEQTAVVYEKFTTNRGVTNEEYVRTNNSMYTQGSFALRVTPQPVRVEGNFYDADTHTHNPVKYITYETNMNHYVRFTVQNNLGIWGCVKYEATVSNSISGQSMTREFRRLKVKRLFNIGASFQVYQKKAGSGSNWGIWAALITALPTAGASIAMWQLMTNEYTDKNASYGIMNVYVRSNIHKATDFPATSNSGYGATYNSLMSDFYVLAALLDVPASSEVHPTPQEIQSVWNYNNNPYPCMNDWWTYSWWNFVPRSASNHESPSRSEYWGAEPYSTDNTNEINYMIYYSDGDRADGVIDATSNGSTSGTGAHKKRLNIINSRVIVNWNAPLFRFRSAVLGGAFTKEIAYPTGYSDSYARFTRFIETNKGVTNNTTSLTGNHIIWCNFYHKSDRSTLFPGTGNPENDSYTGFRFVWEHAAYAMSHSDPINKLVGERDIINPAWYDIQDGIDFSASNQAMLARLLKGYFNGNVSANHTDWLYFGDGHQNAWNEDLTLTGRFTECQSTSAASGNYQNVGNFFFDTGGDFIGHGSVELK